MESDHAAFCFLESGMPTEDEVYYIFYSCTNCGAEFEMTYPRGERAFKVFTCPNCGCSTAEKKPRHWQVKPPEESQHAEQT